MCPKCIVVSRREEKKRERNDGRARGTHTQFIREKNEKIIKVVEQRRNIKFEEQTKTTDTDTKNIPDQL